jgi:phosphoglycolate phosphatase
MIEKYSHVIWDWNGTLFNDVDLCSDVFNNLLKKRNINPLSLNQYKDIFTFPVRNYYEKAGLDFNLYSFEVLGQEWMEEYELRKKSCSLFGDSIDVLQHFRSLGLEQSILSAYPRNALLDIVNSMGIESYFKFIYGLDHIYATGKTQLGMELVKEIGTGSRILFIGDTDHDFEVAKEIGADCVLIADGHQAKSRLLETGALVIDQLIELKKL